MFIIPTDPKQWSAYGLIFLPGQFRFLPKTIIKTIRLKLQSFLKNSNFQCDLLQYFIEFFLQIVSHHRADWSIIKCFPAQWKTFIYQIKCFIFHRKKRPYSGSVQKFMIVLQCWANMFSWWLMKELNVDVKIWNFLSLHLMLLLDVAGAFHLSFSRFFTS